MTDYCSAPRCHQLANYAKFLNEVPTPFTEAFDVGTDCEECYRKSIDGMEFSKVVRL